MSILKPWLEKRNDMLTPITFFLFFDLMSFSSRGLSEAQSNLFSVDNLTRMISLTICAAMLLMHFLQHGKITSLKGPLKWIGIYFLFGFISIFNTTWVTYAVVKYFEYFVVVLYGFYIFELEKKGKSAALHVFNLLFSFFNILVITVLVGLIISPSQALYVGANDYSSIKNAVLPFILKGWIVTISSTTVGYLGAFLSFRMFYLCFSSKIDVKKTLFFSVYLMVMLLAQCRTAIFGFIIACGFVLLVNSKSLKSFLILLFACVLIIVNINYLFDFLSRGQDITTITSISGRTEWWDYAFSYFKTQPLYIKTTGLGFASAEKLVAASSSSAMYALDSEFLGILIGTGLGGVLFWGLSIVEAIKNIIVVALNKNKLSRYDKNIAFVSCGAVLIILFRMITASTLSVTNYYLVSYVILNFVIYTVIKERRL